MKSIGLVLLALVAGAVLHTPAQAVPRIQHWQTGEGMRVYFVRARELPILDLRLVFDAGSARDAVRPGLARITTALLDKGAGDWDADAIAARFEDVGADFSTDTDRDMSWLSLRSLSDTRYSAPALETFIRVATAPSFPERDFERARKLTLVSLQRQQQRPATVASKAFYRALYLDHPYAHPVIGDAASVKAMTREAVRGFYRRYFVARNAVLAMVGDMDRAQAERLAARISAGLAPGEPAPELPSVAALAHNHTERTPFPSEQAHIYMGQPGVRRGDPDYFPLYVGNHILGGSGFSSRLVKEVRVKRGLSYSVYSYFPPLARKGPFQLNLQTRGDQTGEAVAVAKDTLRAFIEAGPSDQELEAAIKNITGGFPLRLDSNEDIVAYLAVIGFYGLPLDYLDTFNDKVAAVTVEDIKAAFRKRLDVDRMVTVIVGGENHKE
jgi:zinc protease